MVGDVLCFCADNKATTIKVQVGCSNTLFNSNVGCRRAGIREAVAAYLLVQVLVIRLVGNKPVNGIR